MVGPNLKFEPVAGYHLYVSIFFSMWNYLLCYLVSILLNEYSVIDEMYNVLIPFIALFAGLMEMGA
jgi:hypothetical protein